MFLIFHLDFLFGFQLDITTRQQRKIEMFNLKPQLSQGWALALICLVCLQMQQPADAELPPVQGDKDTQSSVGQPIIKDSFAGASLNNLYDNLLQREYAGPVVFPNHQVERKAQRSPSLRLRFGRSDPDMLNNIVEKRWFGDVNQKPIRSPSLRLRFGRRDPNLPQMRRTAYDDLLERELTLNNQQQQLQEQLGSAGDSDLDADYDDLYKRVVRKPQRLRWGRSVPQFEDNDRDDFRKQVRVGSILWHTSVKHPSVIFLHSLDCR